MFSDVLQDLFDIPGGPLLIQPGDAIVSILVKYFCNYKNSRRQISGMNKTQYLTQDAIWESDKNTGKHHIQERPDVSLFPAYENKAARNRQGSIIKTNVNHK